MLLTVFRQTYFDVDTLQVIIFDDAGYIAGVQSVLLERDVDMSVNDLTKQAEQQHFRKNDGNRAGCVRARRVDG